MSPNTTKNISWLSALVLILLTGCSENPVVPAAFGTASATIADVDTGFTSRGSIRIANEVRLEARTSGIVNHVEVSVGSVVGDGSRLFEIQGYPSFAVISDVVFWRPLGRGDQGEDVLALQNFLARQGYLSAQPDGSFGAQTTRSVKEWQDDTGQETSGTVAKGDLLEWPEELVVNHVIASGTEVQVGDNLLVARGSLQTLNIELTGAEINQLAPSDRFVFEVASSGALSNDIEGSFENMTIQEFLSDGGEVLYNVTVELDGTTELPAGLGGPVKIVQQTRSNVLTLPVQAIYAAADGSPVVWVNSAEIDDDSDLEQVPVELGISDGSIVEILGGELVEGSVVVIVP